MPYLSTDGCEGRRADTALVALPRPGLWLFRLGPILAENLNISPCFGNSKPRDETAQQADDPSYSLRATGAPRRVACDTWGAKMKFN